VLSIRHACDPDDAGFDGTEALPRRPRQNSHARRKSSRHLIEYKTIEPNTGLRRTTHRGLGVACGLIATEPSNDHTLVNSFEPCSCRALSLGLHVADQATASRSVHSSAPRRREQVWEDRSLLVRPWGLLGGADGAGSSTIARSIQKVGVDLHRHTDTRRNTCFILRMLDIDRWQLP
jgi:hypothetical protein